ncbi:MAG: VOC family protein [Clostridium sp.]|uniref:VOC family protein n=1 Tax=Clostridium sp. TaxID=1506 RepID=UPI002FC86867
MNKITCICLGVKRMDKAIRFYRDKLGFETDEKSNNPEVIFFNTPGTKFELYPLELLAKDINEENTLQISNGFSGITLAYNVENKEDVSRVIEKARNAGAKIIKEPQDVFWGGYHAYFADLDGYYWEVAWGPNFKYDHNGMLVFN